MPLPDGVLKLIHSLRGPSPISLDTTIDAQYVVFNFRFQSFTVNFSDIFLSSSSATGSPLMRYSILYL